MPPPEAKERDREQKTPGELQIGEKSGMWRKQVQELRRDLAHTQVPMPAAKMR
jgi:hypothetical protein